MNNQISLMKYAVNYLSKFSSSKKNLEKILKSKVQRLTKDKKQRFNLYSQIDDIIILLEKNKLINDENYCQSKIRLLVSQFKSKKFIENYLFSKGINKLTINDQLYNFESDNNEWEKKSALYFAKKKNFFNSDENIQKKLSKMARAGFPYEISKDVLKID